ncbi:putative ribosome-binding factor A, mitochondrial isoform X3 [Lathamus discolor]|uniref:putative ribosome-binding factor A, mitochondrial isoform X3 n=1 Tax=Lathamus discolor TaxID=678569 RepID=UPI0032B76FD6
MRLPRAGGATHSHRLPAPAAESLPARTAEPRGGAGTAGAAAAETSAAPGQVGPVRAGPQWQHVGRSGGSERGGAAVVPGAAQLRCPGRLQEPTVENAPEKEVSLTSNFSACRVYWNPTATTEKESYVESVLQKSAPRIRYLLKSQQILGNMPPIVFVKDKEAAAVREIEELLSIADFGPPEAEETSQNDSSKLFSSATESSDPPMRSNLFGIDHELLNKQIMDYKRLKVSRDTESIAWTEEQEQQLSKIRKKMKKKKPKNPPDDDITPQEYLMDRYEADYWDDNTRSVSDYELEDELQEDVNELEADDGKIISQPTDKLK